MASERAASPPFGALLRRHRLAAGLTQEVLAELAGMSTDGIGALERGHRQAPYRATVALLAQALNLSSADAVLLEAAAVRPSRPRGSVRPAPPNERIAHNLPLRTTRFLGRRRELAELCALLDELRFVSLIGSGGIGKTRLALEAAAEFVQRCADGVWFVNLAALSDPAFVPAAVAAAMGIRLTGDGPVGPQLLAALRPLGALLILDNCEHVIAAAAEFAAGVAGACPHVKLLVTSRESLRFPGERIYRLSSLDVPPAGRDVTATEAIAYSAVALFEDRARAADARFTLSAATAPVVAGIVRRLDGIPLAVELAAARVRSLGVQAMSQRLDERFRLLTDGNRAALPRHQTLRAAFDWGYDLLPATQRALFARVAVFAGGWTLEAAEAVCSGDPPDLDVIDGLTALVDKSLVVAEAVPDGTEMRYRLLESTRAYAAEKLTAAESALLGRRHAGWVREFATAAGESAWTLPLRDWLAIVEPEADNIRAALTWAVDASDDLQAGRITAPLLGYWLERTPAEGQRWVGAALAGLDPAAHPVLVAQLLVASSYFSEGERSCADAQRAAALLESADDGRSAARAYYLLATGLLQTGRTEEAALAADRAVELYAGAGLAHTRWFTHVLSLNGAIAQARGRLTDARVSCEAALALSESLGDEEEAARARVNLADVEFWAGDARRALELVLQVRSVPGLTAFVEGPALGNSAVYLMVLGDAAAAQTAAQAALRIARRTHNAYLSVTTIVSIAEAALRQGDPRRAARLKGFTDAWALAEGCVWAPAEAAGHARLATALERQLTPQELAACTAAGARLDLATAIDDALGSPERSRLPRLAPTQSRPDTPAEWPELRLD